MENHRWTTIKQFSRNTSIIYQLNKHQIRFSADNHKNQTQFFFLFWCKSTQFMNSSIYIYHSNRYIYWELPIKKSVRHYVLLSPRPISTSFPLVRRAIGSEFCMQYMVIDIKVMDKWQHPVMLWNRLYRQNKICAIKSLHWNR